MEITVDCEYPGPFDKATSYSQREYPDVLRNIIFEYIGPEIDMLKLIQNYLGKVKTDLDAYVMKSGKYKVKLYPEYWHEKLYNHVLLTETPPNHLKNMVKEVSETFHMDFGDGSMRCSVCSDGIDFNDKITSKIYVEINVPLQLTRNMIDDYGNIMTCKKCKKHKTSEYKLYRFPSKYITETKYQPYNTYPSKIYIWQNPIEIKFDKNDSVFAWVGREELNCHYVLLSEPTSGNNVLRIKDNGFEGWNLSVKLMSVPEAFKQVKKYLSK